MATFGGESISLLRDDLNISFGCVHAWVCFALSLSPPANHKVMIGAVAAECMKI